ncbi:MAG: hypothetical protein H6604_00920 [Flavobacteriales bacterium]|nr:hypothetical protein [Flavobacteriales bacterium]
MIGTIKKIIENKITIIKLNAIDKMSKNASSTVHSVLLVLMLIMFVVFLNVSALFVIDYFMHSLMYSSLIITGFYLLLILILVFAKKSIVGMFQDIFIPIFSKKILKDESKKKTKTA